MKRKREPNAAEVAAAWLWSDDYAKQNLSLIDWFSRLDGNCVDIAKRCADEIRKAKP